jgi:hypothetical protein
MWRGAPTLDRVVERTGPSLVEEPREISEDAFGRGAAITLAARECECPDFCPLDHGN